MKFSEKLIALRKSRGMSQEELGEKLGVTRQTISKWELEQTTPDMNSLNKISELFDVSVDYLANDNRGECQVQEKTVDNTSSVIGNEKRKKIINIVAIILGIIVIFYVVGYLIFGKILGKVFGTGKGIIGSAAEIINQVQNDMKDAEEKNKPRDFNSRLEMLRGTDYTGLFARKVVDEVVSSNAENKDRQIKLTINGVEYVDPDKMIEAKKELENMSQYEIMFKYDDEGYICEAIIK